MRDEREGPTVDYLSDGTPVREPIPGIFVIRPRDPHQKRLRSVVQRTTEPEVDDEPDDAA